MQSALNYRTNRDLFSNHYLTEHLPETEQWNEVSTEEVESAFTDISELYESERDRLEGYNEAQLERNFIRPVFERLDITFEIEETVQEDQRRPDYAFFASEEAREDAFDRRGDDGDFYEYAIAVADAKRWGRKLDTRGKRERDFENPSYQIHAYLQKTSSQWGVLTNGKKWRLYYGPTSHRLDSYYEIDLPTMLERNDLEAFRYFYQFFRKDAFVEDTSGDCFLDDVYDESNTFAEALGEDLQDNIYEAIRVLAEGFIEANDDLDENDLDRIHDSSLIYLYRLIFVLYAESEGRELLPTDNDIYSEHYSLNDLKPVVAENLDEPQEHYLTWQTDLWDSLGELFELIDQGSESQGIDREQLFIPAYNGGLFRTNPDDEDSLEAQFLSSHEVGDAHLAEVIDLLTRRDAENGAGKVFVDYSSLDIRHLGSIYEGLLEYQLNVADEPLSLDDDEYTEANEGDKVVVEEGEVYLTTGSGERKATGSYYTPEYVVEYIVENTLEPLISDIREDLLDSGNYGAAFAEEFAERIFDLKILDPAMGSGHFLTSVIDYLAREIIDAQEKQAAQQGVESVEQGHDINWARRQVAQRCIYGVDLNPLAVELAKVSLWLRTLAAEQPLAFLDHHLKTGNSLVGSDIEEIEELESENGGDGPDASLADFGVARKGTIEQLMRIYEDFIAIENQDLADVKEMESKYDEFERNKLRQRLEAMANVHTAEEFGLDGLPDDAYKRLATALEDDSEWSQITHTAWFIAAQKWAEEYNYFHWRLEFPEAFYSKYGETNEDPGFDAVIGNPPYIRIHRIGHEQADYLFNEFKTCSQKTDLSIAFLELGTRLVRDNGLSAYISTSQWLSTDYGESVRGYMSSGRIRRIVDFGSLPVFDSISTYPAIFILSGDREDVLEYIEVHDENELNYEAISNLQPRPLDYERFDEDPWVFEGLSLRTRLSQTETAPISAFGGFKIGALTGMDEVFVLTREEIEDLSLENEILYPYAYQGDEITKYGTVEPSEFVIYPYKEGDNGDAVLLEEDKLHSCYPNVHEYLESHKEKLRSRKDSRKLYADGPDWYQFLRQGRFWYVRPAKLLIRGVAKESCVGYLPEETIFSGANTPGFIPDGTGPDLDYLFAILNSTLISEYLTQICPDKMQGYTRFNANNLNKVPVKLVDGEDDVNNVKQRVEDHVCGREKLVLSDIESDSSRSSHLSALSEVTRKRVDEKSSYNLDILDYLGNFAEGSELSDIGLVQPPEGASDSVFYGTTKRFEKLRFEKSSLRIRTSSRGVILSGKARYKPENAEDYEVDSNGYTTTPEEDIMIIQGVSENQSQLIQEFVPAVVQNEKSGFRKSAGKTISLVDRFKRIVLPNLDEVQQEFEQYLEVKTRSDELEEEILRAESIIDDIVYDLYGITEDERKIIES